ncbi:hypothetical protein SEA_CBORCH11_87 [Mycobacterium phage Cborch11]|nr:hypothetical protein SEA_CBORCH11_87 [Mycobacterium phage Cborch11]
MPVIKTNGAVQVSMSTDTAKKVNRLMAENGFPFGGDDVFPVDEMDMSWLLVLTKAIGHVEDKRPKHFRNPARKVQIRHLDASEGWALPWRTVRVGNEIATESGWYAITPIGSIDETSNLAIAHGPHSYNRARMLAISWIRTFYGKNGDRYQAEFWEGLATDRDIEVLRSAAQTVGGGIPIPGTEIHEVAIDRRDGRTLWESRYPHAGPVTEGAKPVRWEDR